MTPESLDDILHRSATFGSLSPDHYQRLRSLLREEHFEFGEVIVKQGAEADSFYLLVSGRARVVKETASGGEIALTTLRPGDEFGELALISGGHRNATVRCSTAVDVVRLDSQKFLPLLKEFPELKKSIETTARLRTLHGFLYEFSNFGRLSVHALRAIVERLSPVAFQKGDFIVREGDPAGPMYILQTGRVRVFRGAGGAVRNLAFYRGGDFFGELSILNGSPRAASAEAVTDCELLALSPEAVRDLKDGFPEIRKFLEDRLARYRPDVDARVPLDFAEIVPARGRVCDTKDVEDEAERTTNDEPFSADRGPFRKSRGRIRRMPHIEQIDEMDCGPACLGMIARHFGRDVSLAHIRGLCHTARDGTSLKALCHAASELGLAARALKVSSRNLAQMPLPAIVHWEGNHWIVLWDVGESQVMVNDPALGERKIAIEEFESRWTGHAALFDYTEGFANVPEHRSTLRWIAPFFRRHALSLGQALALGGVATLLQLVFPVSTQWIVDKVIAGRDIALLARISVILAAAFALLLAANLARRYVLSHVSMRLDVALVDFITRRMLALPLSYFSTRHSGDIQRRLEGVRQVRHFAVQYGFEGMLSLVTLIGCLSVMAVYSPALAGVFVAMALPCAAMMRHSARVLGPLARVEESESGYAAQQADVIHGIEAVKAGAAEASLRDRMLHEFRNVSRAVRRAHVHRMIFDGVVQLICLLSTVVLLWLGALTVIAGRMTAGGLVASIVLAAMAGAATLRLLRVWEEWQQISVLLDRLADVVEAEPEQGEDRSRLAPVRSLEGRIELRQAGFRFGGPEAPEVLKGISLEFEPGRKIAIVGRSGSGKTTLVKLLAGLLEPTSGTILLDHAELKTLNYRDVRRQIGLVLQDNYIFNDTVLGNIAFGDPQPDFDRVLWASQAADAHDFITGLPMGYESRVGESGLGLAAGQKQRIAIARALYLDPPILIFDEATSALDPQSERVIRENLRRMAVGRTFVEVAHRLDAIRDADVIVVLEKGEVVETGTHDELMARRGLYFHLNDA